MSYIPVVVPPLPDELLYSWFFRLAKANDLSIASFLEAYVDYKRPKIDSLPYDVRYELILLCNNMFYKTEDLKELFLSHSTFPFEALFMEKMVQARYIDNVFRPKDKINQTTNSLFNTVYICPECVKEDTAKHGFPYLHRSHNLSGVRRCHIHEIPLLHFSGKKGHECEFNDYSPSMQSEDIHVKYAQYANTILNARLNINISDLKNILFPIITQDGFEDKFNNTDYSHILKNLFFKTKESIYDLKYINGMGVLPLLMYIFPDVNDFIKYFSNDNDDLIQSYACTECGNNYYVSPVSYEIGRKCPECERKKDIKVVVKEIIEDNSGYELQSDFISMDQPVKILHEKCGIISRIKPRSFLYENVRCKCEYLVTEAEAKKLIEINDGFKLVNFVNTIKPVTILHEACGQTFNCNYHKFLNFPSCRYCKPSKMDTETYKRRLKKLVGEEYTLVSPFKNQKTKIEIRHNACGKTKWYQPNHFLEGQRCPYCNKITDHWKKMYSLFSEYKTTYSTTDIQKSYKYKELPLGRWCQKQKDEYNAGTLDKEKEKLLLALGFDFTPLETEWNRRFEQYKRYVKQNPNIRIARRVDFEGEHLGVWVDTQRRKYKNGTLSAERAAKLKEIDMFL